MKLNIKLLNVLITLLWFTFNSSQISATTMVDLPSWQLHQLPNKPSLRGSAILGDSMWVTGSNNSVFVSQDGGQTWLNKSVNHSVTTGFRDIELFDENTAIVMGVGEGEQSMLFKTNDGGDSWHLLLKNEDEKGFFDSIAFWDNNKGLLMGDPVDGYYVVKKTIDGGKTWRRITKNNLPKLLDKEAAFAASGNTLIVGKDGKAWLTTGGFSASIYFSDDYGETWKRQSVPLYQETQYAGGYGLALNHQGQPFVVGGDFERRPNAYSNIATYIDGKWLKVDAGERGLRTAMSCQENICITTGKTGNDISYNAGKSWQAFDQKVPAGLDTGFYTLAVDKFTFLAAGADGKVGVLRFNK